jgi:hypothetical protein
VRALLAVLGDTEGLAALEGEAAELKATVAGAPAAQGIEAIKALASKLNAIKDTRAISSLLSDARRALKGDTPARAEAAALVEKAARALTDEVAWRRKAQQSLVPALQAYEAAIRDTIGLRSQERLTSEQADDIAACLSHHRDISLDF